MKLTTRQIAFAAVIGAAYAVLTMVLEPFSYGPIQCRVSEVLTVLPFFFPFATWGLFVGCALANLISAYGILDIVFGSLATLLACLCTAGLGRISRTRFPLKALACLPPVLFNGVIIGAVIAWTTTPDVFWLNFAVTGLQVAFGEAVVLYALGLPLLCHLPRLGVFRQLQGVQG